MKEEITVDVILSWFDEYRGARGEEPLDDGIYYPNQETITRDFISRNYPDMTTNEKYKDLFIKNENDLFILDIIGDFSDWYWSCVMKSTDYNDLSSACQEAEKVYAKAAIEAGMGDFIINLIQQNIYE